MKATYSEITTDTIPPNLRLLFTLEEVAKAGVPMTPTEVNLHLGLPKPTIHRLFATLEAEGFLQRDIDGRSYSSGPRMRMMSANVLSSLRIRTARLAVMTKLAEEIGETCNLAIPERNGMIYIDRVETKWPLRIQLPIGTEVPFYCTASGKLYLSTLSKTHLLRYMGAESFVAHTTKTIIDINFLQNELQLTRERGYSQDNEEFMENMIAVGVPIKDDQGRMYSTLSFHAPTQRLSLSDAMEYIEPLRDAAKELSLLAV